MPPLFWWSLTLKCFITSAVIVVPSKADSSVLSYLKQCSGKSGMEPESEPAKPPVNLEELRAEIRAEIKAKIEEEAYNKGWGLLLCYVETFLLTINHWLCNHGENESFLAPKKVDYWDIWNSNTCTFYVFTDFTVQTCKSLLMSVLQKIAS